MSKHIIMVLAVMAGILTMGAGTAQAETASPSFNFKHFSLAYAGAGARFTLNTTIAEASTVTVEVRGCDTSKTLSTASVRGAGELVVPVMLNSNTFDDNLKVQVTITDAQNVKATETVAPNGDELAGMKAAYGTAMTCPVTLATAKSVKKAPLVKAWSTVKVGKGKKVSVTPTALSGLGVVSYTWMLKGKVMPQVKGTTVKIKKPGRVTVRIVAASASTQEVRVLRVR